MPRALSAANWHSASSTSWTNCMHAQRRSLTWAVELLLETPAAFDLPAVTARTERIAPGAHKSRTSAASGAPTVATQRSCYDFDRDGSCRFGSECRYLHGGRPAAKNPGKRRAPVKKTEATPPRRGTRRRDESDSEDDTPRYRKKRDLVKGKPKK
eukprot:3120358-Pleurochrysis_carterae.AAC.1